MLLAEGEALIESGEADRASDLLRSRLEGSEALAELERDPRAWALLGRAARMGGDYETAAHSFTTALGKGGGVNAGFSAVECLLEMKDAPAAAAFLAGFAGSVPQEARGRVEELRATCLFLEGREGEARPHLERAREAGSRTASHFLGLSSFHLGDYRSALSFLEEALRDQPDDYYSLLYRGWACLELNRLDEARAAFLETKRVASTAEVEQMLGRVEMRAERLEKALEHFRSALASNPAYAEAQFGIATALRRLGRKEEAGQAAAAFRRLHREQDENLRRAYQLNQRHLASPGDPAVTEELARHYLTTGDLQEAERFSWKTVLLVPTRPSARVLLARALAGAGRYREAAFHYRKVLRSVPDQPEARRELEDLIRKHAQKRRGNG